MKCRACGAEVSLPLIDLGSQPIANAFLSSAEEAEQRYPLRVLVCTTCGLAQTDITLFKLDHDALFTKEYPYHSSTSAGFVAHARTFVERISASLDLGPDSLAIEVGSNDGYLLQWFKTPCLGIEPTDTRLKAKGIECRGEFFGVRLAQQLVQEGRRADLMICNNVLAHVPDINDFVTGFAMVLKPHGVATFEFPWLKTLMEECLFDTIYHEHYSYLSLTAVVNLFQHNGLRVFGVEKIVTHGGSLRVHAQLSTGTRRIDASVIETLSQERDLLKGISGFQERANGIKNAFLAFLLAAKHLGQSVVGFGAAAKGNTFLNFSGVRSDLIQYVVDETPAKQGKFLPGSHIPVVAQFESDPDFVLIVPWNFRAEILHKLGHMKSKFVTAIPTLEFS